MPILKFTGKNYSTYCSGVAASGDSLAIVVGDGGVAGTIDASVVQRQRLAVVDVAAAAARHAIDGRLAV